MSLNWDLCFSAVHNKERAETLFSKILYLFHFLLALCCRCFSRSDHLALHMKRHIWISVSLAWMSSGLSVVRWKWNSSYNVLPLQEKRTWSRVILCTGTTCSQCHAPSYTSIPTLALLCLAPAGWEKMQARKWYRGEVSEKEQLLTVLHHSWICFLFLPMEIKENRRGFPAGGRQ